MWIPSFEPSAGAATTTCVPAWNGPPSNEYAVAATPEPASAATRLTVTGWFDQPAGASSVVCGGELSTTTPATTGETAWLPAASVATARKS